MADRGNGVGPEPPTVEEQPGTNERVRQRGADQQPKSALDHLRWMARTVGIAVVLYLHRDAREVAERGRAAGVSGRDQRSHPDFKHIHIGHGNARCFQGDRDVWGKTGLGEWMERADGAEWNCYMMPATRRVPTKGARSNSKPRKDHVAEVRILWVDIDPNAPPEGCEDVEAHYAAEKARLLRLLTVDRPGDVPEPHHIIDSGGGVQAFWLLGEPFRIDPEHRTTDNGGREYLIGDQWVRDDDSIKWMRATRQQRQEQGLRPGPAQAYRLRRIEEIECYTGALAERLGGDDGTWNVDRVMRVPFTFNNPGAKKQSEGRTQKPTGILEWSGNVVTLEQMPRLDEHPKYSGKARPKGKAAKVPQAKRQRQGQEDHMRYLDDKHFVEGHEQWLNNLATWDCEPASITEEEKDRLSQAALDRLMHGEPCVRNEAEQIVRTKSDCTGSEECVRFAMAAIGNAGLLPSKVAGLLLNEEYDISEHPLRQGDPVRAAVRAVGEAISRLDVEDDDEGEGEGTPHVFEGDWMATARVFIEQRLPHLVRTNGDFFTYRGPHYVQEENDSIDSEAWKFLEGCLKPVNEGTKKNPDWKEKPMKPKPADAASLEKATRAVAFKKKDDFAPPCWLRGGDGLAPSEIIIVENGLLHLPTGRLLDPTPDFFSIYKADVRYDPDAKCPRWMEYLEQVFPDDPETRRSLQEQWGYFLVPDTTHHHIFVWEGVSRSGRSTASAVLQALVGKGNYCAPRSTAAGKDFSLEPFIGKQLAVYGDLRIGPRTDKHALVSDLLAISGGDPVDVNRKNISFWTGRLMTRLLMLTNVWPDLPDDTGALRNRLLVTRWTISFQDDPRKDPLLGKYLVDHELPGIMNWAIEGWRRLKKRGHFKLTKKNVAFAEEIHRGGSPVARFVDECCVLAPAGTTQDELERRFTITTDRLHTEFAAWSTRSGEKHVPPKHEFSKRLGLAFPTKLTPLDRVPKSVDPKRNRGWQGLRLFDNDEPF